MRISRVYPILFLAFFVAGGSAPVLAQGTKAPEEPPQGPPFLLSSTAFRDGGTIPVRYTCTQKPAALSPPLAWTNTPKGTVSFAILVHDPDGHPNHGAQDILRWMIWNLPANLTHLPAGVPAKATLPNGAQQSVTAKGVAGYQGPCDPQAKAHHYIYQIFALDKKLDLPADARPADLFKALDGHLLGTAVIMGRYRK
jgi:Raf kinase inhibitor-like YbhB/YbcL family protein